MIIKFIGKTLKLNKKTGKMKLAPAEAPTKITNGAKTIILPPSSTQTKGFTHKDAELLISAYPKQYKLKISKGKSK